MLLLALQALRLMQGKSVIGMKQTFPRPWEVCALCFSVRCVGEGALLSSNGRGAIQIAMLLQAVAGFLMAGGVRSAAYVWKKVVKAWQS